MKIFRITSDVENILWLIPADIKSVFYDIKFDCSKKKSVWESYLFYNSTPLNTPPRCRAIASRGEMEKIIE